MRGFIPVLHNMSWRYFVEWSSSQSNLQFSDIVLLWY